ncbi:MAG: sugar nucleotide-binding protein [Methanoregula sp.]|jgi:dTDP-4-dehydrorhamnose reductase|uniref:SDR family oxidoreductase n=1 Tax=Methanoregula sp. TaxID=2052170 RepID=UPI003D0D4BCF
MGSETRQVLITGTTGLVGCHLYDLFRCSETWITTGTSRSTGKSVDYRADLTDPIRVRELARNVPADVVIHAAAISKTDVCQADRGRCYKANVESTKNLISAYPHAKFIFFSTYAVYNTPEGKCDESAPVSPTNYYIETKLLGENLISPLSSAVILRPSVIFGFMEYDHESKNYFMQLVENIRSKKVTQSPVDQYFNPIHVGVVAEIVRLAIVKDLRGIYNIGSNEDISKFEFNQRVMRRFRFDETYLEGIDSRALAVTRPNNGTISSGLIQETLKYRIPRLSEMIDQLFVSTQGHPLLE